MRRSLPLIATLTTPLRLAALVVLLSLTTAVPGFALLHIDFEQPYYVHPGMQVWDFCVVENEGTFHIFYHGIPLDNPTPAFADTIFTSTSSDLIHWSDPVGVLTVSDDPWESRALWAPDVVFDPGTGLWWMAYTAVDDMNNQRIAIASSPDLVTWQKSDRNPIFEPDPETFFYDPAVGNSECRDPFLYREDGTWFLLATAKLPGWTGGRGALARISSTNMIDWSAGEAFLANDGTEPYNSLESPQYHVLPDGSDHVFFHEFATVGVTHLGAIDPADWSFTERTQIDLGIAPEVDTFDGGANWIFSRIAPFEVPDQAALEYVARFDTLSFRGGPAAPTVIRFSPLARHFETFAGNITLGNPTFGDNPARRGEEPIGLVGNFYFGSSEYFQGPLSGRGAAGREIGNTATGYLESYPFVIEGSAITMLLSGTDNPDACFVALMDAAADTVLRRAHGSGVGPMTEHTWDVVDLLGREVYIRIEDSDPLGRINVDEIRETDDVVTAAPSTTPGAPLLADLGPSPNPFNPSTRLRWELAAPTQIRARIHDLRGRLVWDSGPIAAAAGPGSVVWTGVDRGGVRVSGGVYVYRLSTATHHLTSGKLTLVP
jgi:hypothetical protein